MISYNGVIFKNILYEKITMLYATGQELFSIFGTNYTNRAKYVKYVRILKI